MPLVLINIHLNYDKIQTFILTQTDRVQPVKQNDVFFFKKGDTTIYHSKMDKFDTLNIINITS